MSTMALRLVIVNERFQAEICLRSAFRRRTVSPRELALVLQVLDRVWSRYEALEGNATVGPQRQEAKN